MMTEENWKQLEDEFKKNECFDENNWYTANGGYPPFDLMDWLDCSSTRPSWDMVDEYKRRGYRVFPVERDSFGWLIGAVEDNKSGRRITFG